MQNHVTWIYIYIYIYVSTFASLLIYINIRTYYYHTIYIYISIYTHSHPLRINDLAISWISCVTFSFWVWLSTRNYISEKQLGLQQNRLVGCHHHHRKPVHAEIWVPGAGSEFYGVDGVGWWWWWWQHGVVLDLRKAKSLFYIFFCMDATFMLILLITYTRFLPIHAHIQLGLFQ